MAKNDDDSNSDSEWKGLFDAQSNSSEESCQTKDEEQVIEVGDTIKFYNEMYVNGHDLSYPWTLVEDIIPPEEGYILTQMPYQFNGDSLVKILTKKDKFGIEQDFEKGRCMYLKKYHFQKLSVEDKHKMNEAKENERKKRRDRIEILKSIPFPINKNETINDEDKVISTDSTSEIEGFFGNNEQRNASESSLPTVMLIGMVTHRSLSCCDLAEIKSTSARDLIGSSAIENFTNAM